MIGCVVDNTGTPGTAGAPAVLTGDRAWEFAFCPSARSMLPDTVTPEIAIHVGENSRRSTATYSVGYKERVTLETNTGANWMWRRIVFTLKNLDVMQSFPAETLFNRITTVAPYPGYVRSMYDYSTDSNARFNLYYHLFQGSIGADYQDIFNAPVNTNRVRKIYDRVIPVGSGNNAGHWKQKRFWHPVRKMLYYNEKEGGDHKVTYTYGGHFNDGEYHGTGDLWVVDMFACANGKSTDSMNFLPQGTYYWHER